MINLKKTAFTLIELLVVIVIIGILATISVAQFNDYQERARLAKAQAFAKQAATLLKLSAVGDSLMPLFDVGFETEDQIVDKGGLGTTGSIYNAVWKSGDDCLTNGCYYFNGTNAKIHFDTNQVNWQGQGSFSISAWFRAESYDSGHVFRHGGDETNVISLRTGSTSLYTGLGDHVGGDYATYSANANYTNRWQHALISYNADTAALDFFVDGNKKTFDITPTVTALLQSSMQIGSNGNTSYFKGYIDDIALYPVALEF